MGKVSYFSANEERVAGKNLSTVSKSFELKLSV